MTTAHSSSKPPALDPEHQVDRDLLGYAIDELAASRMPRPQPVPAPRSGGLPDALPEEGSGAREALALLAPGALGGSAQLHHPGYLAHMDPPTPAVTWAAALWQVATNQNLLHPDVAAAARGLAEQVVAWLAPFFGMTGGHLVPGATVANITALWAARDTAGVRRVAASEHAHLSVRKAADLLGLDYVVLPAGANHRVQLEPGMDLSQTALVLTAGTVASGAVDPLVRPPGASWVHVDAAWAGPLRLSRRHASLLAGIESADSVGFSAHKWLYQPKGSALVLFRDTEKAHGVMTYGGGYLATPNVGLLGSAPASALPLAASLLAWGRAGVAHRIEADLERIARLEALARLDDRFECWGPATTGVLLWRPRHQDPRAVRDRLSDAWVSLSAVDDQVWLRSVAANPSADPEHVYRRVCLAL